MSQLPEIPSSTYTPEMNTLGAIPDIPSFEREPMPVSRNPLTSGMRPLQLLPLPGTEFPVRYETSQMRGFQTELRHAGRSCVTQLFLREHLRDTAVRDVPAQRYQDLCQMFGFARSVIAQLYSERHERDLEIGRLRRHQSCQSGAMARLQMEVDQLRTILEVEGIPLDFSEKDDDGSSFDDAPPSPPP
ncbi:hypothetical protein JCGZ_24127 [Jatropha curcas]|uniref:Uncharacterized protein n=1 Tax=Jatropha curcas TaxID=180498 RepID=A0A067LHJ2_JATCU|nr:hypothetical protein JCGZ_24127 [Jatropha curcas]